jgi:hypothetical protein
MEKQVYQQTVGLKWVGLQNVVSSSQPANYSVNAPNMPVSKTGGFLILPDFWMSNKTSGTSIKYQNINP